MLSENKSLSTEKILEMYGTKNIGVRYIFNYPIRRPSGQWTEEQSARFIHSMLQGDPIPPIYIAKYGNDYMLLDGLQRFDTLFNYIRGNEKLWLNTPPVIENIFRAEKNGSLLNIGTETTDISGLKFFQLSRKFKKRILNYSFEVKYISQCTSKDIDRIIFNLNNGSPNKSKKVMLKLGSQLGGKIRELSKHPLFLDYFVFSQAEEKRDEACRCVLAALTAWTGKKFRCMYMPIEKAIERYKGVWNETELKGIREVFDTLYGVLPELKICGKFMKASYLPIIIMNVDKYLCMYENNEISKEQYKLFLKDWFEKNRKNTNAKNIEKNINAMDNALENFVS